MVGVCCFILYVAYDKVSLHFIVFCFSSNYQVKNCVFRYDFHFSAAKLYKIFEINNNFLNYFTILKSEIFVDNSLCAE